MARKIPVRLLEHLAQAGVAYQIIHHPVAYTAQELAAIEGVKGRSHAKVVILHAGQIIMAVLPSDLRINFDALGQLLGHPVRMATEIEIQTAFPDCEVGTMPPFGHLYDVPMYLDETLAQTELIVFEAGTHSDAIKMRYTDYAHLAQPTLANFAVKTP